MTAEPLSGRGPNEQYEQQMQQRAADRTRDDIFLKARIAELEAERKKNNLAYETLEAEWKAYTAEVYGEQRPLTVMIDHPETHEPVIGYLRADEARTVHIDPWTHPETRRELPGLTAFLTPTQIAALCGAPKVLAGRFDKAIEDGTISLDVAAQVCEIKTKTAYIALAKPDAAPQ